LAELALSRASRALLHDAFDAWFGALAKRLGLAWLGVMALCSAWLYVAEHGINKAIDRLGDGTSPFVALWWGVVTLTTVGYGDAVPVTDEGRLAAMVLMLLGIVLFGAVTATITSYLMSRDVARVEAKVDADVALDARMDRRTTAAAQTSETTTTGTVEGTSSAGGTLVDELERLARLHESRRLTDAEFSIAKRACLNSDD
jgi:hypothetical protein